MNEGPEGRRSKVYGPLTASVGLQAAKHDVLEPLAETVSLVAAWTGTISQANFVRYKMTFILSKQAMESFRPIKDEIARIWSAHLS